MRVWAQSISLGLSLASIVAALWPRTYTEEHTGADRFQLIPLPKLIKFPVFWLGLSLLGYIALQALNPAWIYESDGTNWWLRAIAHHAWLPTGVEAPFEKGGPWRTLVIYASAWLTVCAVRVAFTRRRTVQLLFMTLALNGLLLAAFGVAQRLGGNGRIFWFFDSPNAAFFSSFIYKNHAGAYLNLALAVAGGLAGWYYLRGLRRLEKSNPSGVLVFFATCIAVSILISYARGATLVMLVFVLAGIVAFIAHQCLMPAADRKPVIALLLVLMFGCFLKAGFDALRPREAWSRLRRGITQQDTSLATRALATQASLEMLRDHGGKGAGAGSFRFVFPVYQVRYPDLTSHAGRRMYWEHAHNDLVQIPIELGRIGIAPLILTGGYWMFLLIRSRFWANPLSAGVVLGALLLVVYAWWDFPLQCPAILVTWCVLWPATTLWTQFEELNARG